MSVSIEKFFDKRSKSVCIIAEVAQNHDGSLGQAHAFIEAIAKTGADVVKFQTHIAEAESTPEEPFRVKFSYQDKTRYNYWKRMEFTREQWKGLAQHAKDRNLIFLSSPFSLKAVDLLESLGTSAWKVGSGEATNILLLERILKTRKPVLLSTGLISVSEINKIVSRFKKSSVDFALFQNTTVYPCPPEKIGLNIIPFFKKRYNCPVGLSDHSGTIFPSLAAVALGAQFVEVHVTLSREMFGPDIQASITIDELKELALGIRFIKTILAHPVDKDRITKELKSVRKVFSKSLVVVRDLPAGTTLKRSHLTAKKPGTGIPVWEINKVIGKTLAVDVSINTILKKIHFKK